MPAAPERIAVRDTKAADMLDMTPAKFRRHVANGALPPPVNIGGDKRWLVDQIKAILNGDADRPDEDFDL